MKKIQFFTVLLILSITGNQHIKANNRSPQIDSLENEVKILKNQAQEIRNGQFNYSIERDLLKETYSANYEKLNILITVGLGIGGILTFLGIRDINSIKKDFKQELDTMRVLKSEFENKSKTFDQDKERFDSEIKKIINQNEEQNKKIKVLELKEKVKKLMEEKQNTSAYEYCTVALELAPEDLSLITNKAILQCRLNNFPEAADNFGRIYDSDPQNTAYAGNYVEALYFINNSGQAKGIIEKHSDYFNKKRRCIKAL